MKSKSLFKVLVICLVVLLALSAAALYGVDIEEILPPNLSIPDQFVILFIPSN